MSSEAIRILQLLLLADVVFVLLIEGEPLFRLVVRRPETPGRSPDNASDHAVGAKVVSAPAGKKGAAVRNDLAAFCRGRLTSNVSSLVDVRLDQCKVRIYV